MAGGIEALIDCGLLENFVARTAAKSAIDKGSTIISPLWLREMDREYDRLSKMKDAAERQPAGETLLIRVPVKHRTIGAA